RTARGVQPGDSCYAGVSSRLRSKFARRLRTMAVPRSTIPITIPISREPSRAVNEDGPDVVHVGPGRARAQQISKPFKEFRRIIVIKEHGRIEAGHTRPRERGLVDQGASGILRRPAAAIGAVGVAGQRRDAGYAPKREGEGEGEFLVGTP